MLRGKIRKQNEEMGKVNIIVIDKIFTFMLTEMRLLIARIWWMDQSQHVIVT